MRYRAMWDSTASDTVDIQPHCYLRAGYSPQCPYGPSTIAYNSSRYKKSMLDIVTPNFYTRMKNGDIINNDMASEVLSVRTTPTTLSYIVEETGNSTVAKGEYYKTRNAAAIAPLITGEDSMTDVSSYLSSFSSERDIAITEAYANISESDILAFATVGELPETIRWFALLAKRVVTIMSTVKRKKFLLKLKRTSAKDRTNMLADIWMEARYALRPLMFEAEQIAQIFNNYGEKPDRGTARGYHNVTDTTTTDDNVLFDNAIVGFPQRTTTVRKSSYRAGVLYAVDFEDLPSAWVGVLGLDQPLESMWELTTLSFALDWFFDLGDLIASWTPNAGLTPLACWVKETHHITTVIQASLPTMNWATPPRYFTLTDWTPGTYVQERRLVVRTASPTQPLLPHIDINLDMFKIADLIVIARNICRAVF